MTGEISSILPLLRCPECKEGAISDCGNGTFKCDKCGHSFNAPDDIPDFRPETSMPHSKLYDDPALKNFNIAEVTEFLYNKKGILTWVQEAGHRAVTAMRKGRKYKTTFDLGCGHGAHYPYMDENCGTVFGLDIDQKSLAILKKQVPDYIAIRGDAYNLPLKDSSVDCIVDVYNIEHLMYLDIAFEEMSRIMTDDADAYISVPCVGGFLWTLGAECSTVRKYQSPTCDYRRIVQIEHINCIWQIEKAIKRHFIIDKRYSFPFGFPFFHFSLVQTYRCKKRRK